MEVERSPNTSRFDGLLVQTPTIRFHPVLSRWKVRMTRAVGAYVRSTATPLRLR